MNLNEELRYYCSSRPPAGAFMITGEWGSGKTYFVENELPKVLGDDFILIRISLFGKESVKDIYTAVAEEWFLKWAEVNFKSGKHETLRKIGDIFKKYSREIENRMINDSETKISSVLGGIPLSNQIKNKSVVLIFDDLERVNISYIEALGCINDFCENKQFFTIIIANEDVIGRTEKDDGKYSYYDIIEKVVLQKSHFEPDYKNIVSDLIKDVPSGANDYKSFLEKNIDGLTSILVDDMSIDENREADSYDKEIIREAENECNNENGNKANDSIITKPHNVRSFKYAIRNFERVYNLLEECEADDIDKWLISSVCLVMADRAKLIEDSDEYGGILTNEVLKKLYFGSYNSNYMSQYLIKWLCDGTWDEEGIKAGIANASERNKAFTAADKVRTYNILAIDDSDLLEGFPVVIDMAYRGELSLDNYINLIDNSCWARTYNIPFGPIDWEKIKSGIEIKLKEVLDSGEKVPYMAHIFSEDPKNWFSPGEWEAYQLILNFCKSSTQTLYNNIKGYINLMETDAQKALIETKDKRYEQFTKEMMEATIDAFKGSHNDVKWGFSDWFENLWNANLEMRKFNFEDSLEVFKNMENRLSELTSDYVKTKEYIAAELTRRFGISVKTIREKAENMR